ncbi:MAG: polyprenyl synthetase family protein [Candidatus Promineifilaceae bacterium]
MSATQASDRPDKQAEGPAALQTLSAAMLPAVEQELRAVLQAEAKGGDPFYGMLHYHMGWADQGLGGTEAASGKLVRSLLCLLVCQAAGGVWRQALPPAAAIEMVHNFSLIHDDIQDGSPARRGRPAMWRVWGANQAINSGDALFALAHLALGRLAERGLAAPLVLHALRRLDETCVELTLGQHADMGFEARQDVGVAEYLAMIGGKTAALLALAAELGALITGCEPGRVAHFANFGRQLGLAFQVRDDILGIWGDEAELGKSAATDIISRKKSLPVLFGLSRSPDLRRLYAGRDEGEAFVGRAVAMLDEVGARAFSEAHESAFAEEALDHLAAARPEGVGGQALLELSQELLGRRK